MSKESSTFYKVNNETLKFGQGLISSKFFQDLAFHVIRKYIKVKTGKNFTASYWDKYYSSGLKLDVIILEDGKLNRLWYSYPKELLKEWGIHEEHNSFRLFPEGDSEHFRVIDDNSDIKGFLVEYDQLPTLRDNKFEPYCNFDCDEVSILFEGHQLYENAPETPTTLSKKVLPSLSYEGFTSQVLQVLRKPLIDCAYTYATEEKGVDFGDVGNGIISDTVHTHFGELFSVGGWYKPPGKILHSLAIKFHGDTFKEKGIFGNVENSEKIKDDYFILIEKGGKYNFKLKSTGEYLLGAEDLATYFAEGLSELNELFDAREKAENASNDTAKSATKGENVLKEVVKEDVILPEDTGIQNDALSRKTLQRVSKDEPKGIAKLAFKTINSNLVSDLCTLLVHNGGIHVEDSIVALVPSLDMVYIKLSFEKVERTLPNGRTEFGRPISEEIGYIIGRRDVLISQYKTRLVRSAKWHYNNEVWLSEGEVDRLPFSLSSLFLNDSGDGLDMCNNEVQEILELFKESFETQLAENQALTLVDGKVSIKSWYFDEEDDFRLNV